MARCRVALRFRSELPLLEFGVRHHAAIAIERGRATVSHHLAGILLLDAFGEGARIVEVGMRGLPSQDRRIRRKQNRGQCNAAARCLLSAGRNPSGVWPFGSIKGRSRSSTSLVNEAGGFGVGAGDDDRRHAHGVGREAGRGEATLMLRGRDQNLAAEMAALLFRGQLVLEVDACGA